MSVMNGDYSKMLTENVHARVVRREDVRICTNGNTAIHLKVSLLEEMIAQSVQLQEQVIQMEKEGQTEKYIRQLFKAMDPGVTDGFLWVSLRWDGSFCFSDSDEVWEVSLTAQEAGELTNWMCDVLDEWAREDESESDYQGE